jgi:hypothetical protein
LRFVEAAAGFALLREFLECGGTGGLRGKALAQRRLFSKQACICPQVGLQLSNEVFDLRCFGCG